MKRWLLVLITVAACSRGTHREARAVYNEGVTALAASDWAKAEEAFLKARSEAGVDPELRWRAAFDLGLAYAGHAASVASGEKPDLEQALDLYGKSAGWFQDAIRLDDDPEARANLEIVRARQQALADQLSAGEKALEKKLDRLIDGQREVRDQARALLEQARAGSAVNPTELEDAGRGLATTERVLLADAGVIVDLAGAELDTIDAKLEADRSQEDQVRLMQLRSLEPWVQIGRTALADTRRMLDEGKLESAHERADEAVDALKRARETLLDPVAVLRAVAQDQLEVADQTSYLDRAAAEAKKIGGAPQAVPAWLTAEHLGGRQRDARSRLDELTARLRAAVDAAAAQPADAPDPQRDRMLERVRIALPDLDAASAAMMRANDALATGDLGAAVTAQQAALIALAHAIEQFLELRGVLDLAWTEQNQIVTMLTGDGEAATLPPETRSKHVREGLDRNLGRVAQLAGLLEDENVKLAAAAAQAQQQDPNADPQQAAEQQAAAEQQLAHAELLRTQALAALQELAAGTGKRPPLEPATDAQARITELRTLFFSIIEHLEELIRAQGETVDDTAEAAGLDDLGRAPLLPGLVSRQGEHRGTAQAIADALAAQADALAQGQAQAQPGGPDPAQQAQQLGQAAEEVRAAGGDMDEASGLLTKAGDPAQTMSFDLTPAVDAEKRAVEHLEAALQILQPPQQQDQQQEQEQEQDQQQQDQQQEQDQQQQDQQQDQSVDRRREQVREQEAQRRREREEKQRNDQDPVEKDW